MDQPETNDILGNKPPTNVKELCIHFFYQAKHINNLDKNVIIISDKIDKMSENFVTKEDLTCAIVSRKEDQKKLEDAIGTKADSEIVNTLKTTVDSHSAFIDGVKTQISIWAVVILIGMILANYGIQYFFKG